MRIRYRLLLFMSIVASFVLTSCKTNKVSLDYTNAKDEMPLLTNIVFQFNQPLMADSLLNIWDSTDFVTFSPAIKGKFRWQSPDELVFSPAQPLAPATNYTATVNKSVLKFSKFDKVTGGDDIKFHTPDLSLVASQVIWQGESATSAIPQVDMQFNYAVDPNALKDKLTIEVDGKKQDFTLVTVSPDTKISVRLASLKAEDKEYETKITIGKGLKPETGSNSTGSDITNNLSIPSPYVLTIQDVQSEHDGTEGIVRVSTSQQVTGLDIRPYVTFDPAIAYTVDYTETGFNLRSDKFNVENAYSVTFKKGLRGKLGGVLKEDFQTNVAFGQLEADIRFTNSKAVYLSKQGGKNLEIRITSVPKIKVVVSKIYENNLLMAQRYGYYPQETTNNNRYNEYDGEYYDGDYYGGGDITLGDVIFEKEIDTRTLPKSGGGRLLNFSQFEDRLPEFKGVYHVMIRSTEEYWVRDSRFISLSDLGLIAKEGQDKILVFANSLKTALPEKGVDVMVYAANNQLLGTGSTNADGVAEVAYTKKDIGGFKPAMVIAKTATDFNYLPFNNTRVNTSRFEVGGKRTNPSGFDAFVYAERDIYRPGEKINFSLILRNSKWETPGAIPLKLKFLMPNGKELKSFRKNLNEEGSLEASVDLATSAITGTYNLEVYTSNDILLSTKTFSVEEFVPDRIKVAAKLDKPSLRPGETASLAINATNFFGPPAANRNYELEVQVKQKYFTAEKFSDYDFSLSNKQSFFDKVFREGKTDDGGNANEQYEVPASYSNMGALQASFYTTVFDETGRPVSRGASADIYTQSVFFGIKRDWYYYQPLNQAVKTNIVAVNKEGNAVSTTALVKVIKQEYKTVLAKSGSYFRYTSQREEKVMIEGNVQVSNNTVYTYVPRSPGDYEVRVYIPGSNSYVAKTFYSYGSYGGDYNSFEVNNEGNIDIELDKKAYNTGETVKALFKTPFSGRMLVTYETDKVIGHEYVNVENRSASVNLKLSGEHVPNVYITATLIKPHEVSDIPLTVAHGFMNVSVTEKNRKINVEIQGSKTVRSKTKQKIKVKATPGSYVTLAAVDNGVLQITDFKTPDPYDYFYQKKALQVTAYDLYPLLFAEVRAKMSSTGGDGALDMAKRTNPMPAKRVKVVSFWSGIVKANGSGEASFDVEIPQFSGELRLMAVAYKGNSFGAGENTMTVADPIVISSALPRFLSPGDTVLVPVTITNTTEKAANVTAAIKTANGTVKVMGNAKQSVSLQPKAEQRVLFNLVADPKIGVENISVTVDGMGEQFVESTDISVRPPSTLQKRTDAGSVQGGSSKKIGAGLSDLIPGTVNYELVVSRSPVIELGSQLQYLVQYPYGCTEQTISAAFPQLYYGDLADLMKLNKNTNANTNVIEAIRKIKMRQLYNGAVTMWDGGGYENWWTTVYAAHFLLEARKAGFEVDNSLIETMLTYITLKLRNRELITYYYNREQNKKIAPKEVAYGLYVLALAGRSNVPAMNYYKANPAILALDSRYLLSAAYAIAGDKKSFAALLPPAFSGEESVPQTGGSFYSDVRDEAIALNALIDVDPGNKQVGMMVKHVSDKLKSRSWLSTQERAFAFLALGKHAKLANQSTVTAEIKSDGKTIAKVDGGSWRGDKATLKGTNIEIVTKGSGNLYYFWQAEGISATGDYKEEDSYLKVRRRYYNRFGQAIEGGSFKQNELIIIAVTLEKNYSGTVENVVITDLLPAGFEIENPRTKEIPGMDWIKDGSTPDALDVRDDRIHFFVNAGYNKQTYYYAVRAVSPGLYKQGPVSADAMYNGEYHSYNGAGLVRITP